MPELTDEITWLEVPPDDAVSDDVTGLWVAPLEKLGFVPIVLRVTAMLNFTNRLASGLGWLPNREYFSLGR